MTKILVIHGVGINMRGKVQTGVFGTMTMADYDMHINQYASELRLDVEIFHSNIEGEVINKVYEAHENGTDAAIINPAGYSTGHRALVASFAQVDFPVFEVHISNPIARGGSSDIAGVSKGVVMGFGVYGYYMALKGIVELLKA